MSNIQLRDDNVLVSIKVKVTTKHKISIAPAADGKNKTSLMMEIGVAEVVAVGKRVEWLKPGDEVKLRRMEFWEKGYEVMNLAKELGIEHKSDDEVRTYFYVLKEKDIPIKIKK